MAVGFEWQSVWHIYKTNDPNDTTKFFPKNTLLTKGLGWKLVTDGADMEFVVDHVPLDLRTQHGQAMDGETRLLARMESITHFCEVLDAMRAKAIIVRSDKPQLFAEFPDPFWIENKTPNHTLKGFVQVTGGIRLTKLRKVFKLLSEANSPGAKDLLGESNTAYSAILNRVHLHKANYQDTAWPGHEPSKKQRSLAELIALYMYNFRPRSLSPKSKVVKYLTFIMSRTDFGRLFGEIDHEEVRHYQAAPDAWVRYICTDVMQHIDGFPAGADPDGKLIEFKINDMGTLKDSKMVTIPITRREWLRGMTQGKDVLTAAAHPTGSAHPINSWRYRDVFGNHRLRGLGGLGDTMDTLAMDGLEDNQGAIFEFRAQADLLNIGEWTPYTVRAYRFLQTVNFGQQNT